MKEFQIQLTHFEEYMSLDLYIIPNYRIFYSMITYVSDDTTKITGKNRIINSVRI